MVKPKKEAIVLDVFCTLSPTEIGSTSDFRPPDFNDLVKIPR